MLKLLGEKMPIFEIKEDLLYQDGQLIEQRLSPNHGGPITPRIIVIHYTGTEGLESPLSWLCNPASGVSAHLLIDTDGTVYQLLPFSWKAWHAGKSEYNGQREVNTFSIGIENVGTGAYVWPDAQIEAIRGVCEALYAAYQMEDIVGHEDVAIPPGRKGDPGPNFPWDKVAV